MDEQGVNGVIQAFLTVSGRMIAMVTTCKAHRAMVCLEEISHYIHTADSIRPSDPSTLSCGTTRPFRPSLYGCKWCGRHHAAWEASIDQIVEFVFADACHLWVMPWISLAKRQPNSRARTKLTDTLATHTLRSRRSISIHNVSEVMSRNWDSRSGAAALDACIETE